MKLNKLWAGVLALFALTACNKDIEPSASSITAEAPQTKQVNIEITAGQGLDNLRTLYDLNEQGAPHRLFMEEKNLMVYVAVKRGESNPVFSYETLEFIKTPGKNRATYSGQISVPSNGSGDYKIAAVLLGEKNGDQVMTVKSPGLVQMPGYKSQGYLGVVNSDGRLDIPMTYLTKWTDVSLNAEGTTINPILLNFAPRGTVLRYRVANYTNDQKQIKRIHCATTAFATNGGVFVKFEEKPDGEFPSMGRGWQNYLTHTFGAQPLTVPAKTTAEPSYSDWFYAYVFPFGTYDRYVDTYVNLELADGSNLSRVFRTHQALPHGAVKMTLPIRTASEAIGGSFESPEENNWGNSVSGTRPKLALEYVAEFVMNNDPTNPQFLTQDQLVTNASNVGFYTYEDAVSLFANKRKIGEKYYSLPSQEEICSIFPSSVPGFDIGKYVIGTNAKKGIFLDQEERNVKIGEATATYSSDFNVKSSTLTYALRFKSSSNYNRTAFRYQYFDAGVNSRMVVTCRYVGEDNTKDIQKISEDSFWSDPTSEYVTRTYPMYGYYLTTGLVHQSVKVLEWSRDLFSPEYAFATFINKSNDSSVVRELAFLNAKFCVRLWERD